MAADTAFQDILLAACGAAGSRWQVEAAGSRALWLRVAHAEAALPEQGWKLHLSATVLSAPDVLRAALPVLLAESLRFKIAASESRLAWLNAGEGGVSQAGKFLTVYPADDAQAVRLASALDRATRGGRGPAIPSDRPLRPGSLVHYRYGPFRERFGQLDRRELAYCPPEGAEDPFLAAGLAEALPDNSLLVAGRYLIGLVLHQSARGAVLMTLDTETGERRTLKMARRDAAVDRDGEDGKDRLRREAAVLARLAPDPRFPRVYDLLEHAGDLYLVMEDMEGVMLDAHVDKRLREGRFPSGAQVIVWGREIAALLGAIHECGFVFRDLKSSNLLVAPDGRLRGLDFEYACPVGEPSPRIRGTRGYLSPAQAAGAPPTFADDAYALGAALFFTATGAQPSYAPHPFRLCERPPRGLNPALGPKLADVIADALSAVTPSLPALDARLADCAEEPDDAAPPFGAMPESLPEPDARQAAREAACRWGDALCRAAVPAPALLDGAGLTWPVAGGPGSRDLHDGDSGIVLALAALVKALGVPAQAEALAGGARRLLAASLADPRCSAGLYDGEAGVGAALLRAGQALRNDKWIAAALARGRWVAALPFASPDLLGGAAGRARFHLWLWDAAGDAEALKSAVAAGDWLRAAELEDVPPGYAHGAAGIGDVLLDLFGATGEERFRAAAQDTAQRLANLAVPTDNGGVYWPVAGAGGIPFPFRQHGAAGIGPFLLRAARAGLLPDEDLANRAAWSAARWARWAGPALANGLAGNMGALLDCYAMTGDVRYRNEARSLSELLRAWNADDHRLPPSYLTGAAGIAACWLRLAEPDTQPNLVGG